MSPAFPMMMVPSASTSVVAAAMSFLGGLKLARGHLARLPVLLELEGELLTFNDRGHAGPLNSGDVNKDVGATVVRLNEAKALGGIEPFNCASGHNEPFQSIE